MDDGELRELIEQVVSVSGDEVVTRALSRDVTLPHAGRTAVLITLDNGQDHTRPNTLGPRGLGELNAARIRPGRAKTSPPSSSPASRSSWPPGPA